MTVSDLETRMSPREFTQWIEWYVIKQEAADAAEKKADRRQPGPIRRGGG